MEATANTAATAPRNNRSMTARKAAAAAAAKATQGSGSELSALLERIWVKVQTFAAKYAETTLPTVHMITGMGQEARGIRLGHLSVGAVWAIEGADKVHELFVSGETLGAGPVHALTTILHEATHLLLLVQGDATGGTSRQNRYHNDAFRKAAETFGLEYTHGRPNGTYGFSAVALSEFGRVLWGAELETLGKVTATIPAVELVPVKPEDPSDPRLVPVKPTAAGSAPRGTQRRRVAATCGCRTINVFADECDDLVCGKCMDAFTVGAAR